ncbi:MAG: sulfotransferase domain-containing protein [Actinomycetota bacterium]|nr:sulfotransferase domain-containing protein [Actinomycetota bacterium]
MTTSAIVLPDFLVIGASKGGTVWINECLREHPDVYLTRDTHEIFFFDRHFDRGVDWYAHHFRGHAAEKRVGDITSTHLAHPQAPARVRSLLPSATLIASLRNPIDRAWSRYLHVWRKGQIPSNLTFWEASERDPGMIGDGEYFRCLLPWRELFPLEQLHLLVLDDAEVDPFAYMRRVYEILGVDPEFRAPSTTRRANEHKTPRSIRMASLAYRGSAWLHRTGLHAPIELAKRVGLQRIVLRSDRLASKEPTPLSEADRERLSRHYEGDVAALSELIGRDLVGLWLTGNDVPYTT